jgi:hypothetical protein
MCAASFRDFLDLLPAFYSEEHAQPHSWFSRRKFQVPTYLEYFTCRRSKPGLACQSHFPAKPYIFSCLGAKSCQHFQLCNDRSIISKILHFSSFSHALPIFQALCLLVSVGRQSSTRVHSSQHLPKRVGVRLLPFKLSRNHGFAPENSLAIQRQVYHFFGEARKTVRTIPALAFKLTPEIS